MANNSLKYRRIEAQKRKQLRRQWNQPVLWPVVLIILLLIALILPAMRSFQRRAKETIRNVSVLAFVESQRVAQGRYSYSSFA
jgi:cytoskeletal protein RodZ